MDDSTLLSAVHSCCHEAAKMTLNDTLTRVDVLIMRDLLRRASAAAQELECSLTGAQPKDKGETH